MQMSFKFTLPALALAAAAFAAPAMAAEPIYAPVGTPNAATYSFVAAGTGPLTAYYLNGTSRSFTSRLVVLVNGVQLGSPAFTTSTAVAGDFVNFGNVNEGDEIEFKLQILSPASVAGQEIWSTIGESTPSTEDDGLQQIFSESWGGGAYSYSPQANGLGPVFNGNLAAGDYTFVAFEDILGFETPRPLANDFDYNDHRFAFTNVKNIVPEPATWAMMITGFGLVGFAMRRRKSTLASVSA
jgi:hypothetical protein